MFSARPCGGCPTEYARFFDALTDGRARLALLLEPQTRPVRPPGPVAPVRGAAARALLRVHGRGRDADRSTELRQIKTAYEQDVLRKSVADFERGAQGRHARRRARQVRIRSRGGDRRGLPAQRRHELGLSVDRRQRPERDDPALQQIEPPDGAGRSAARRCRRATTRATPATSPAPIRSTARSRREQRDIYEIVLRGAGGGHQGREGRRRTPATSRAACDEVLRAGLREARARHRRRRACSSRSGRRTA